jgi:hypothetical protein
MSLADDAKILLIPSGYKTATPYGKLYSVFPTDGNQDFRIDRATTGTRINPGGLIETMSADTPRLDHYGGNCPSVLREVGRTNLLLHSEDLTNSVWSKISGGTGINPVVTSNYSIAPDGTMSADRVIFNQGSGTSSNDYSIIRQFVSGTTQRISSIYIKSNTNDDYLISVDDTGINNNVTITNEWQRFDHSDSAKFRLQLSLRGSINSNYADVSIWGGQLEDGIGATSYIKTTTASVTRNLDNINCENETYETGNDVTWFLDFNSYTFTNSFRPLIVIRNSGFTETMDWISYNSGSDYYFRIRVTNQSSLQTIIAFGQNAIQMFQRNKVAVRLYGSNYEIYVNGVRQYTGTSTNGDWKIINNSAILNDFGSHSEAPSMKLYDFRVYDKTMTQSDLETLTTL